LGICRVYHGSFILSSLYFKFFAPNIDKTGHFPYNDGNPNVWGNNFDCEEFEDRAFSE
jgi:hypothetical protein